MPVIDMFSTVMNSLKEELLPDPPGAVEEDKYNNNIKNNIVQKTENTVIPTERIIIDKTKTENTVIPIERPHEESRKLENRNDSSVYIEKILFSKENEKKEEETGINTVFSSFLKEENTKDGINTVFSSFLEKSGQVENRISENRTLESENSPPVEQVNNDFIEDNKRRYNEALMDYISGVNIEHSKSVMVETINKLNAMGKKAKPEEIKRGFELCRI